MRTKAELQKRLLEAAQARKQLLDEEATATQKQQSQSQQELALEIANLSGVIGALEWVLQTNVSIEYDVEVADTP
jgi:hypothetical protein